MKSYSLVELEKAYVTQGLVKSIGKEFYVNRINISKNDAEIIIDYIVKYLIIENKQIKNLETFGCGSWLLQFVINDLYIELYELKDVIDGYNHYEFDITLTVKFYKEQLELSLKNQVTPVIPKIGQKIAISKEIYENSEVNGVRYSAPNHMAGWYLTSNLYNGDVKTLLVDHLYHILKKRPDLAKFLALPVGFRFFKDNVSEDVWFDQQVLNNV